MSYLQIEIGGKLRGLKFNQGTVILMNAELDKMKLEGQERLAFAAPALLYAALRSNSIIKRTEFVDEVEGKETPITFEMVSDWFDKLPEDSITKILNCFTETQDFKVEDKKENKKKLSSANMKKTAMK